MSTLEHMRPIDILLVEDNPGDVNLTVEALEDAQIANRLHVVNDGEAALSFLHREGEYAQAPHPAIILLDLNLPKKGGREVLAHIKQDPHLRRIPVVILTTSTDDEDVRRAYDLHANCYITKPVGFRQFFRMVHAIEDFWLTVVRLPPSTQSQ